jgi:hypothetical protein
MGIPSSPLEAIDSAVRTANARVRVSLPAKVLTYNPVTNSINAEIQVKDFVFDEGEREYETLPAIPNVPVQWPRAGGKIVRLPIVPGDYVLLVFSSLSLAEWRLTGQLSEPKDSRRNSIGYCFAIPGVSPDVSPPSPADVVEVAAGGMIVGEDGGAAQMVVGGTVPGIRFGKAASSPVALSVPVEGSLAALMAYVDAVAAAAGVGASPGVVSAKAAATTALAVPASSTLVKAV